MLGFSEDEGLMRLLFAAPVAADSTGWLAFLEALRQRTGAAVAGLRVAARGSLIEIATGPLSLPPLAGLRSGRIYAQDEFDGSETKLRLLPLTQRTGTQIWLAIGHPFTDFRAADGALLTRLTPALDAAVATGITLARERRQRQEAEAVAGALGAHWLWLDATGRIVEAAPGALPLLAAHAAVRVLAGRLDPIDPLRARALRRALDEAPTAAGMIEVALGPALGLALFPGLAPPAPGSDPVIRAVLRRPPRATEHDPETLAHLLGTSRSEARLAALICDGLSLAEAAEALGWTIETTRSASKRLYQQTGTAGQTALLRRMQTGMLWFQPD